MAQDADGSYSVEEWYKDTLQNYPEDLEELQESKLVENDKFDIHAVLNANGDYEDLTQVVKDPSKIIVYDTWNQMLKDRNNRHTYYIRQNGDKEYEVVKYSQWSSDLYTAYLGPRGYSSLEELYARNPGKYDTDDVCLVKEFHYDDEDFDESLIKDNQKRGKKMKIVAEDFQECNLNKMGTNEYEANTNRDKHVEMYRKFANLNESEEITEDNINDWALQKTATYCNRHPDRIKAEILGKRYSEYERD